MKVLLVGNYELDGQMSMKLIADMLAGGLADAGVEVKLIKPTRVIGRGKLTDGLVSKLAGYVDKLIIFPFVLRREAEWADIIQICDHSNALYLPFCGGKPVVVTCHDVLAIRGALKGDTDCLPSMLGHILQRWILWGLKKADHIVCVSEFTGNDLKSFGIDHLNISVALEAINSPYRNLSIAETQKRLSEFLDLGIHSYVFHVGTNHKRKNRVGVLKTFSFLKGRWKGDLVLVGEPLNAEMKELLHQLGLSDKVIDLGRVSFEQLEALYNGAFAFLYPSRFEGYGWPMIEAQACGCPVVCSYDCGPFPEVVHDSALMCSYQDEKGMADQLLSLVDKKKREELIVKGLNNVQRFTVKEMIDKYIVIYKEILNRAMG